MDMTIDCPECGTPLRIPEAAAGRRGRCTSCGQRFMVPSMQDLLDATVSHLMVASIEAEDEAEDAFEDALQTGEFGGSPEPDLAGDDPHDTGTIHAHPVVGPNDTGEHALTTDAIGPADADAADLIDITADFIAPRDPDASAASTAKPVPRRAHAAAPISPGDYPSELVPTDPRPYLVVRQVTLEGVVLAFDAHWLKHEVFRTSMPMRCAHHGTRSDGSLLARPMIFPNRYTGPETPLHSLESRHEIQVASHPSPRALIRAMGLLEDFKEPYDRPVLHYVSAEAASSSLECSAYTDISGKTACRVTIPHHRTALDWLERVNGRCGPEYALLRTDIARYADDAWRRLADRVRQRVAIWCKFEPGETFKLYLNDPDFIANDAGLAGLVITDRRLIYHMYRRSRSVCLNQDARLHISVDNTVARLTLEAHGRAARCGKLHKDDLPALIDALADATRLQIQVRKAREAKA